MTKKRKKILILSVSLAFVVICCIAFVVFSVNNFQPLQAPENLKVENEVLYWDAVPHASGYEIDIDGIIYEAKENQLSLLPMINSYKTYSIQVSAEGKNRRYSDWSEPYSYEVVEPEGFYESLVLYKENNLVTLKTVGSPKGKIIIPSMLNGVIIERIGIEAFYTRSQITSLYIPSTVKEIGGSAFGFCDGLQRIYLESVEKINGNAFYYCTGLEYAFVGNCNIIHGGSFGGCKKLRRVEGTNALQKIGDGAFAGCAFPSFHIPAQLADIEAGAFNSCYNLSSLTVDEKNPVYRVEGNCVIRKENNALVFGCSSSVIPDWVTYIEKYAFLGKPLEHVVIPDGVSVIEEGAFLGTDLKHVVIPEGVKIVEDNLFSVCLNLTDVQLPNSLEAIGDYSFSGCESLIHITLNEGLKKIGNQAFNRTPLKKLEIPSSVTELGFGIATSVSEILAVNEGNANYYSKGNCIFSKADGKLVAGCAASTIPTDTKVIGEGAFYECPITEIALPEGLEVIELAAFSRSNLQCVEFPSSLREIQSLVFYDCNDIKYFSIPDSVEAIGTDALNIALQQYVSVTLSGKVKFLDSQVCRYATVYLDYIGEGWNDFYAFGKTVYSELRYDGIAPYVYSIECPNVSGIQITVPFRKGYDFMGWATEEGSDAVAYPTVLVEKRFVTFPLGAPRPEVGTRLYAIWKELDA